MPDDDTKVTDEPAEERDAPAEPADAPRDAEPTPPTEPAAKIDAAYVRKLEKENKKRAGDVAELKKELTGLKTASDQQRDALAKAFGLKSDEMTPEQLTEQLGQANTERDALRTALVNERIRNLALIAAQEAGAPDTETVLALIDPAAIEVGEDGTVKPEAVTQAVANLKERKPHLFAATGEPKAPLGATRPGPAQSAPALTREQLGDPAFYLQNRERILDTQFGR